MSQKRKIMIISTAEENMFGNQTPSQKTSIN
jgi:hypothetical protein